MIPAWLRCMLASALVLASCPSAGVAQADVQPEVRIQHVSLANAPRGVQLHVRVTCDSMPTYGLVADRFQIKENGTVISPGAFWIARPAAADRNDCFDAALVFDNSSFLPGGMLSALPGAGALFIDSLNASCQSTAVITYAGSPTIREFLTSNRSKAKAALAAMAATGGSAMYDALRAAITELSTNGWGDRQYILIAAAGPDNASQSQIEQVLNDLKPRAGLLSPPRVIAVAVGPDADTSALMRVVRASGGFLFMQEDPAGLSTLYDSLVHRMRRGFDEYLLTYSSPLGTPDQRHIEVRVTACDDTVATAVDIELAFPVTSVDVPVPHAAPVLGPVHPLPASGEAWFNVKLGAPSMTRARLIDLLGRTVAVVYEGSLTAGTHTLHADVSRLPVGMYIVELQTAGRVVRSRVLVHR